MCTKIIVAREKEECIARQRSPITREIYSALLDQAKKSLVDSAESVVFDWFTLIRITGLRCAEYAQKTQTNIDEHEYASGKRVIKAFVPSDWKFYNSKGRLIIDLMEVPAKLKLKVFFPLLVYATRTVLHQQRFLRVLYVVKRAYCHFCIEGHLKLHLQSL